MPAWLRMASRIDHTWPAGSSALHIHIHIHCIALHALLTEDCAWPGVCARYRPCCPAAAGVVEWACVRVCVDSDCTIKRVYYYDRLWALSQAEPWWRVATCSGAAQRGFGALGGSYL